MLSLAKVKPEIDQSFYSYCDENRRKGYYTDELTLYEIKSLLLNCLRRPHIGVLHVPPVSSSFDNARELLFLKKYNCFISCTLMGLSPLISISKCSPLIVHSIKTSGKILPISGHKSKTFDMLRHIIFGIQKSKDFGVLHWRLHGVLLGHFWSTFGVLLEYFWGIFGVLYVFMT